MGTYLTEIYEAERTEDAPDPLRNGAIDTYHANAATLHIEARHAISAMQKAVNYCRDNKINPCEIRLVLGPDIQER